MCEIVLKEHQVALFGCDGEVVEGRNMSNDCAVYQSQEQCFTLFYLHTFTFVMWNCLIVLLGWNLSDPKGKFSFYVFTMNKKLLSHLYL